MEDFTLDEVALPYQAWDALSRARLPHLHPDTREWLYEWNALDLAANVRPDDERRFERRGHYLGWFAARQTQK